MLVSISLLILYPVALFIVRNPIGLLRNILSVLFCLKSWVGYYARSTDDLHHLPAIRKGVLNPADAVKTKPIPPDTLSRLNLMYARDYKFTNDLNLIVKRFRELGRN